MPVAALSLIALIIAILVSCFFPYNVGLLSIALAFLVALVADIKAAEVLKGFPVDLFVLLAGVTYLFGIAQVNGTLERLAQMSVRLVRGRAALVPLAFTLLAFLLSAIGPGPIPVTALLAPPAMVLAQRLRISPFLMALLVTNGANAAAMSPFTPSGVVAAGVVHGLGMDGVIWRLFRNTALANLLIAAAAYLLCGGLALWRRQQATPGAAEAAAAASLACEARHYLTLAGMLALLVGVLAFKLHVGLLAIAIGAALTLARAADEGRVVREMPWGTILMVCGVTLLVNLMGKTGGLDVFIRGMAAASTPLTVVLVATFIPAVISVYSSTTGVVLPAFLPLAPGLAQAVGGTEPVAIISGMCLGSCLVDASPLSTLGALALGAATPEMDKRRLFHSLMIWGLSMSVIGAILAWLLFGVLRLA